MDFFRGGLPVASGRGREVRLWADAPGGSYKLGGFHDSGRFEDGNGGRSNRGNQGFYAVAEQEVWRAGGETDRALAVFGRVGFAPDYRNLVPLYFDTGFNFRGSVPGRVDDTLGLGFSYAQLSDQLVAGGGHEQVLELTYRLTLGDHIFLQPDLQFIIHPGATDSAATAMVAGLRLNLSY
ncbi:MAG: carbohydrate porin [Chthoniobacterales bacterium]